MMLAVLKNQYQKLSDQIFKGIMKIHAKNGLGLWCRVYLEVDRQANVEGYKKMSYGMRNVWVSLITFPNQIPISLQFPFSLILKKSYFNESGKHALYFPGSFFFSILFKPSICMICIPAVFPSSKSLLLFFIWAQWLYFCPVFIQVTLNSLSSFFQVFHQNLSEQVFFSVLFPHSVP